MVQKTITLDADAVDRLERAKKSPDESLSSVVRRAVWPEEALTGGQILALARQRMADGSETVGEDILDALDAAQANPRRSESEWRD